ncbi:N-acetylmannosamine kinase [Devosia limi DSM 17137]|uniref:Putative N-acetylmannosamine-6-phosphate 2-epimerase n=1 Tax=Devosia limi DSM 17137 TaxID=1121477 RepID=A0A0F5LW28_9HYPH|nr:putative N-acetylmannosamine-6-phosphate 2-epimerase [Devosia limi]KKB86501.1 N-acetylmannosamine kinase [Devosia limi DSM 17137]SHE86392.1 N-acetylmannosamine-6-phosphate 2-epimerase / N-acetylmannosamine kinase [Devosia limi DSM 17137]
MTVSLLERLEGGLIVSCQPVDDGPLDTVEAIVAFALAARDGGARALRIEGAVNVAAVAKACDLPIVGIVKRDLDGFPVRITPYLDDVNDLADAGAHIIAVDATDRPHPVSVPALLAAIHARGRLAMADLADISEATHAKALGFDIIGTTMSGYTGGPIPREPDLEFLAACRTLGGTVVAEGRYNTPAAAAAAMRAGASAVCVGSAITRTEHVTGWFRSAVDGAAASRDETVLALDIGGTKTLAALVRDGIVLDRRTLPTPGAVATPEWFDSIAGLVAGWEGRYRRVGAAVTGVIDDGHWFALNPTTLSIPERTPLVAELERRLAVPTVALNDAQAAAWGEFSRGAGIGRDMAFVTVSSGIGGGAVLNGRLITGARGLAGSLGQIQGSPAAPRLESRASGFAIAAAAGAAGHPADTRAVFAAADAGESWATGILHAAAADLAIGLCDLQRMLDPALVVLGGGIGLLPAFRAVLDQELAGLPSRLRPAVVPAQLGADAGIIGVADFVCAPA